MKFLQNFLFLGLATALVALTADDARGQGYGGWHWPYSYGYSYGLGPAYGIGNIPTPPYFALHPPVYYGRRVSMPYGNSPMTRPPRPIYEDFSPSPRQPAPVVGKMIVNPYVTEHPARPTQKKKKHPQRRNSSVKNSQTAPVVSDSRLIENPHVSASSESGPRPLEGAGPHWVVNPFVPRELPLEPPKVVTN